MSRVIRLIELNLFFLDLLKQIGGGVGSNGGGASSNSGGFVIKKAADYNPQLRPAGSISQPVFLKTH